MARQEGHDRLDQQFLLGGWCPRRVSAAAAELSHLPGLGTVEHLDDR
jgi:hypothetical protein